MDKKVTKRDMMLDDNIDELEDSEDILAALRFFFEEDPLLKVFFNGMKDGNQAINMNVIILSILLKIILIFREWNISLN